MPELKLGRLPARYDRRTLRLRNVLRELPPPPDAYDVDAGLPVTMTDDRVFVNDQLGDCVIAARAHMTMRFEDFEQKSLVNISDDEVKTEYFYETGGIDSGLVMLNSLNFWRKTGWKAAGQSYTIYAYGNADPRDHTSLMQIISLLRGAYIGIYVPQSALDQFNAGQPWTYVPGSPIRGGHCIYLKGYSPFGPECVTWGKPQKMDWNFYDRMCEEAYGVVDNRDNWLGDNSPVDLTLLDNYLHEVATEPPDPGPPVPPTPPKPPGCAPWARILSVFRGK